MRSRNPKMIGETNGCQLCCTGKLGQTCETFNFSRGPNVWSRLQVSKKHLQTMNTILNVHASKSIKNWAHPSYYLHGKKSSLLYFCHAHQKHHVRSKESHASLSLTHLTFSSLHSSAAPSNENEGGGEEQWIRAIQTSELKETAV